ncbi:MAG: hypothetical protein ABI353_06010 [Isosphaeraceae bacterium]
MRHNMPTGPHPDSLPEGKKTSLRQQSSIDWRAWLALAWASWFAVLYVRTVLECRAPEMLAAFRHWVGR